MFHKPRPEGTLYWPGYFSAFYFSDSEEKETIKSNGKDLVHEIASSGITCSVSDYPPCEAWRKAQEGKGPKVQAASCLWPGCCSCLLVSVVLSFRVLHLTFLSTKHFGFMSLESYYVLHIAVAQQIIIVFICTKVHCSGTFSSHFNALGNKNSIFAAKPK